MKQMMIMTLAGVLLAPGLMAEDGPDREKKHRRGGEFHEKMLEKFDADGDGKLNESERAEAKKAHEARREEMKARHEAMKEKFDTDGDGKLSKEERDAAFEAQLSSGNIPPEMMERLDRNGDGTISDDEKAAAREHHQKRREKMKERREKMLAKCDTNGDGEVSEEERKACREKMRGERGGKGRPPRGGGEGAGPEAL